MKKIYTTILSVLLVGSASAQVANTAGPVKRSNDRAEYVKPVKHQAAEEKAVPIWSSTFGTPSDWVIAHDAANYALDWQIGTVSCAGGFPTADIASTTASDGWALLDSDNGNNSGTNFEDAWLTMANPVDLNLYPNVIVEFETHYRAFNNERCYLVVGIGDGMGNVTWPDLDPTTDVSAMANVFPLFDNINANESTDNPFIKQVNISPALVGLTSTQLGDIYIRLNWTGIWGYAWFVDDFKILEQPQDDLQMLSAWVAGENNEGTEYGRNPDDQLDANWYVGAEVLNFGVNDQTNVVMTADFGSWNSVSNLATHVAGTTEILESLETPTLTQQLYQGTYTVVSTNETGGTEFYNNTRQRNFEVTDHYYSQDGIDVHPAADLSLSSMGTDSFTGAEDGLILGSWYHIKNQTAVGGIELMLANGTDPDSYVIVSLVDTADFFVGDFSAPLVQSQITYVTAGDISAGSMTVMFDSPYTLNPGCYYACVEMFSDGGTNNIRILDDITIAEPYWASAIFIPQDQSYTNGEALGIRLMTGNVGLNEVYAEGVSVYPNPSNGMITVTNDKSYNNTIEVFDVAGQLVFSDEVNSETTIDLKGNGTGVYLVKITNEIGTVVERVVIK